MFAPVFWNSAYMAAWHPRINESKRRVQPFAKRDAVKTVMLDGGFLVVDTCPASNRTRQFHLAIFAVTVGQSIRQENAFLRTLVTCKKRLTY